MEKRAQVARATQAQLARSGYRDACLAHWEFINRNNPQLAAAMKEAQQQGEIGARKYEEFSAELAEGFQAGLVSADVLNRIWHLQAALRKPEVQRGMQGVKRWMQ
jgi:hypothetical protein